MSIITHTGQIRKALDAVLDVEGEDMYISITREDFEKVCPNPTVTIHLKAKNPAEAVRLFQIEGTVAAQMQLRDAVLYLKGASLTMSDLEMIDCAAPQVERFRKCISLQRPEDAEVEIWLFASRI